MSSKTTNEIYVERLTVITYYIFTTKNRLSVFQNTYYDLKRTKILKTKLFLKRGYFSILILIIPLQYHFGKIQIFYCAHKLVEH